METEKAKKTRRKETEKSGTKRKVDRKRTKGTKNKTIKTKTTAKEVIRIKDVRELVDYYKQQFRRKPFQGASIDFHPKKPAYVYLPDNSVTKVDAQALLDFLKERNVKSVLVDALNKKRAPILLQLCEAGIEVHVLRRTNQIKRMREELERHGIKAPKTDKYDAVLLAFTPPKKWMKVDSRFLKSWEAMTEWRNAEMNYRVLQQRCDANNSEGPKEDEESEELRMYKEMIRAKLEEVQKLLKEVQKLEAQLFVLKVQKSYPGVDEDFDKYGIRDDVIAQAYYCEAFLEALHCDSEAGFLVKSGIGKAGSPPPRQRKKFIHDGALNRALTQLAVKVYHLDPYKDEGRKKIKIKARKLAEKIWKKARRIKKEIEGGRVGEALGPPPLEREGSSGSHPRPKGRALLRKAGVFPRHPAPGPKHPADG
jgi:uroporphyrinogen-III synthase